MSKTRRGFLSLIIAFAGAVVPGEGAEFSRAFSEYPTNANPRTLISGKDGYLYGVIAEFSGGGHGTGGGIFRVAPDDDYRMLHRFDITRNSLEKNAGGATPSYLFLMARDGCLYGLAQNGGIFGQGVLYRIRPDGAFSVIAHLDPSQLPPGTLDSAYFVYGCRGFLEGPDDAFYTCITGSSRPNIVRIGRDGVISVIGRADGYAGVLTDPDQPRDLLCVSTSQFLGGVFVNQLKVTRFRVPTGWDEGVVQTITSPVIDNSFTSFWALSWTPGGLLLRADLRNDPGHSARLLRLKLDGSVEVLADIGWAGGDGVLPYMDRFVHFTDDGTLYYASQSFSPLGSSLIERKADGNFRVVCGFGPGEWVQAIPTPAGDLCGASFASQVYLPKGSGAFSPDWMTEDSKHEVLPHNRRGGLFFQVSLSDSPVVNSRPLAVLDVVKAKRSQLFSIQNLRNDWDPEGDQLAILQVTKPQRGFFDYNYLESAYQSLDGGRSSGFATYKVQDRSSRASFGTILIRGNPGGTYINDQHFVGRQRFTIEVKPNGTFTAAVPRSNGRPVILTGELDWYNRGLAQIALPTGEWIALSVRLVTGTPEQTPGLDYRIRHSGSADIWGTAWLSR